MALAVLVFGVIMVAYAVAYAAGISWLARKQPEREGLNWLVAHVILLLAAGAAAIAFATTRHDWIGLAIGVLLVSDGALRWFMGRSLRRA